MINTLFCLGLYIFALVILIRTNNAGNTKNFYEMPFYSLLRCFGHLTTIVVIWHMWNTTSYMWKYNDSELSDTSIFCETVFAAMIIIYLLTLFCQFFERTPFRALRKNYKTIKSHGTPISYSVFKKMYTLHPESFEFTGNWFLYKRRGFSLSPAGYVAALFLIAEYEHGRGKREITKAQREIYDEMQRELNIDLENIGRRREDALAQIDKAAKETCDILDRLKSEK